MTAMSDSFAALSQQQRPAKRNSRAENLEPLAGRTTKPRTCVNGSDSESEDDFSTLLNSGADQNEIQEIESGTTLPANKQDSCKSEGEDELLNKLALDFTKDDKMSSPVSKQLAEIINKRWASKLSDHNLMELSEKYDRPEITRNSLFLKLTPRYGGNWPIMGKSKTSGCLPFRISWSR